MTGDNISNFLNICSYNFNSVRKKVDIVREILMITDVLLLQEIILRNEDSDFIAGISDLFDGIVLPSKCSETECFEGRPSGGLAIIWRKSLNISIELITLHDNFMIVLLTSNIVTVGLVNVYMLYDDRSIEMLKDYSHILGELQASISELPTCDIVCLGDFNADPSRSRVWNILKEFCDENQLRICDLILPPDTFTYLSPSHNSTSWLDHVLCSGDVTVTDIKVLNNLSLFDHFPITVKIDLKSGETLIPENKNHVATTIY